MVAADPCRRRPSFLQRANELISGWLARPFSRACWARPAADAGLTPRCSSNPPAETVLLLNILSLIDILLHVRREQRVLHLHLHHLQIISGICLFAAACHVTLPLARTPVRIRRHPSRPCRAPCGGRSRAAGPLGACSAMDRATRGRPTRRRMAPRPARACVTRLCAGARGYRVSRGRTWARHAPVPPRVHRGPRSCRRRRESTWRATSPAPFRAGLRQHALAPPPPRLRPPGAARARLARGARAPRAHSFLRRRPLRGAAARRPRLDARAQGGARARARRGHALLGAARRERGALRARAGPAAALCARALA
jgi:hypothetical protein